MDARETYISEQARGLTVSVPAAGLLHGVVSVVEQDYRWVRPIRFAEGQMRALGSCQAWHPGLYRQMARTTAGVSVEFETDACRVALEVLVDAEPRGTRAVLDRIDGTDTDDPLPHDGISADVDKRHVWFGMPEAGAQLVEVQLDGEDPEDALGIQPLPGMSRTRHVRIWLPALRGCLVREVLCDGTFIRPVAKRKHLLVLGDSIVQGFVSEDPAYSWPAQLAGKLGLDLINQGINGQVFQPGSLYSLAGLIEPEHIVIAYGARYRHETCMARLVSLDIRSYLAEVSRLWPRVQTHVLTPLWQGEEHMPAHSASSYVQVPSFIATHAASHEQMVLVDGQELMDADASLIADDYAHPNADGCKQIATRLYAVMRVPRLRPSSVGKRRKPRSSAKEISERDQAAKDEEENLTARLPFTDMLE